MVVGEGAIYEHGTGQAIVGCVEGENALYEREERLLWVVGGGALVEDVEDGFAGDKATVIVLVIYLFFWGAKLEGALPHGVRDEDDADITIVWWPWLFQLGFPNLHHSCFEPEIDRWSVFCASSLFGDVVSHHSKKLLLASFSSPLVAYLGYTTASTVWPGSSLRIVRLRSYSFSSVKSCARDSFLPYVREMPKAVVIALHMHVSKPVENCLVNHKKGRPSTNFEAMYET